MLINLKKCPVCGRVFDVCFYVDYAYKRSVNGKTVLYCGYNCMRTAERRLEEKAKAKKQRIKTDDN